MGIPAIEQNYPFLGLTGVKYASGGRRVEPSGGEQTGGKPESNGLIGVNTNLGIGSEIGGPTQAGHKLGGRTLAFA